MKASRSCRFQASCCRRKTCSTAGDTSGLEFWAVTLNEQESRINTTATAADFVMLGASRRNQCRIVSQQPTEKASAKRDGHDRSETVREFAGSMRNLEAEVYARPFFAAAATTPAFSQGRLGRSATALSRFSMRS